MRIGIMGAAGTGKTTLATSLAESLGLSLVDEGVRRWLARQGLSSPWACEMEQQIALQRWYLEQKIHIEANLCSFVSDRTGLDAIVVAMLRGLDVKRRSLFAEVERTALLHAATAYDVILLLPRAFEPHADGCRSTLPEVCKLEEKLLYRYAVRAGCQVLRMPPILGKDRMATMAIRGLSSNGMKL